MSSSRSATRSRSRGVSVDFTPDSAAHAIEVSATVKVEGKTGVEMEALTAVSVACLTIYDMCKSADRAHAHRRHPAQSRNRAASPATIPGTEPWR